MIRFGLLGCGRIAKRHSDLLGGHLIEGARLVAVCDPIRARADVIAAKFGVPASYDIDDFLARKDIDAISVLTPSGLHPRHVIACAKAGKHVVVEKPAASGGSSSAPCGCAGAATRPITIRTPGAEPGAMTAAC